MKRHLARRCSRPAAGHVGGRAAQQSAAGLLSGRVVRQWAKGVQASLVGLLAIAIPIVPLPTQDTAEPTASELVTALSSTYSTLDAFNTVGVVTSEQLDKYGKVQPLLFGRRDFTAFYSAPSSLLFSMVHRDSAEETPWSFVLAVDGDVATTASPPALNTTTESVPEALSGASAITSQAAAVLVGLLLSAEDSGFRLSEVTDAHLEGTELIRDVPCWKLSGRFAKRGRQATLWVSKADPYVLRVVLTFSVSDDSTGRYTIDFTSLHAKRPGDASMISVPAGKSAR